MSGPLKNIRVIDMSRVLAGPFCTQILGDLGAEIIKIEKPGQGDETRFWGPPFLKDENGEDTTESAYYLCANRNKKSLTVNAKSEEGQALIHDLLATGDIFIENFKTGGLDAIGLGYKDIHERHPHIIYCAITGFGQTGPKAKDPGYDFLAQALSGLMACTGNPDDQPMKIGVALSDVMTGLYAAIGILSALHHREKTGEGQLVDAALLDCSVASLVNIAQYYLTSGKIAPRLGNAHSTIVPYQAFATQDSYIIVSIGNDGQFQRFCNAGGHPEWAEDVRFSKNSQRVVHREELVPMIDRLMRTKTTQEWMDILHDNNIPGAPVQTMDQVFEMPQIQDRHMEIKMSHPATDREISLVGSPLKLSGTPVSYREPPPQLGQHTEEILANILKLTPERIEELKKNGTI